MFAELIGGVATLAFQNPWVLGWQTEANGMGISFLWYQMGTKRAGDLHLWAPGLLPGQWEGAAAPPTTNRIVGSV